MSTLVETHDLFHRYGDFVALQPLNLAIPAGSVYGFIGPNGAGKTTTMRILTTLLLPSGGDARVAGFSVKKDRDAVRKQVGFMPDFFGVYDNMQAWEYLDFFAGAYKIPNARRPKLIADLLELVNLSDKTNTDVMGLSRGMKQRLSLARTMIHDPALLILDEPASGLDPRARVELRELLKELRAMGKTIMISSHILTELAEMCTHIGIIDHGKILAAGDVGTILRSLQPHRTIEVHLLSEPAAALAVAQTLPGVTMARLLPDDGPRGIEIDYEGDDQGISRLLGQLIANECAIIHFASRVSDLEEIFMQVTGRNSV